MYGNICSIFSGYYVYVKLMFVAEISCQTTFIIRIMLISYFGDNYLSHEGIFDLIKQYFSSENI